MDYSSLSILAASPQQNPLLHDFGLPTLIVAVYGTLVALLLFLLKKSPEDVRKARLTIRTSLSSLFQRTVVHAARNLVRQVDEALPRLLSQPGSGRATPTRFTFLAAALRGLADVDPDSEGREGHEAVLKIALAGLITSHYERVFEQLDEDASRGGEEVSRRLGIRVEIDSTAEPTLDLIANFASRARKCETHFFSGRKRAIQCFLAAFVVSLVSLPAYFIDAEWAYITILVAGGLFVVVGATGFASLWRSVTAERWLTDTSERYATPDDWVDRLSAEAKR